VLKGTIDFEDNNKGRLIAMSGIANPASFAAQCELLNKQVVSYSFSDHYDYTTADIAKLLKMLGPTDVVMVTEKDASKLLKPALLKLIPDNKFYVLPVEIYFLFNEEERFKETVKPYLK
jgi:tetraacyldisaccharide 4'-kinase